MAHCGVGVDVHMSADTHAGGDLDSRADDASGTHRRERTNARIRVDKCPRSETITDGRDDPRTDTRFSDCDDILTTIESCQTIDGSEEVVAACRHTLQRE